jgi:hypothetical protein
LVFYTLKHRKSETEQKMDWRLAWWYTPVILPTQVANRIIVPGQTREKVKNAIPKTSQT